jgi:hypothetical protein
MAQMAMCGSISDGCGGTLDCGSCGAGLTCQNNACLCTPTTCAAQGTNCGTISNGCGGTLDCGLCLPGVMCVNNVCQGAGPGTPCAQPSDCASMICSFGFCM